MASKNGRGKRSTWRRLWLASSLSVLAIAVFVFFYFPGRQRPIAMRLATGIDIGTLQEQIDGLEEMAIHKRPFSEDHKAFLREFYATLAKGARLTVVLGESGRLMDHYLDGSGEDFELDPSIFQGNAKVQERMGTLRAKLRGDNGPTLTSPTFYMPDPSNWDSVFGLYHGTISVTEITTPEGTFLEWRAEVPWTWPTYESLKKKHGDYHAENFPLPNPISLVAGKEHALQVDNALAQYLTQLGLAKAFVASATWREATYAHAHDSR